DVPVRDRTVHGAVLGHLAHDLHGEAVQLLRALARPGEGFVLRALELGAARFELRAVLRGRRDRLAVGNEIVARESGPHLHLVAEPAEVADLFEQNDFHAVLRLSGCRYTAAARGSAHTDRARELALVARLGAGVARRNDAAGLGDEGL